MYSFYPQSGRLFIRNLAYTCTEDDIQKLFEKHGPLSEVNLPLDKNTNKTIGIGYVTFLMPEHAVKAFNELDGHVFQGRLLHILPSKAKKSEEDITGIIISLLTKRWIYKLKLYKMQY